MSIPRWHHRLNRPGMFESPEGVYVHHSDHARVVEAADRMRASLSTIVALVRGEIPSLFDDLREVSYDEEADRAIAAYDAAKKGGTGE